jgi:ornithine cyclodeaminase/alanine dehydrogenase
VKVNGNFPQNGPRFGLPTIQGLIMLGDGVTGAPLCVMDSIEITIMRTAAATAVAARRLARPESSVLTICGFGSQGRAHLKTIRLVFPAISTAYVFDIDPDRATRFAAAVGDGLHIEAIGAGDFAAAVRASDICITCTTARRFFLNREFVSAGTFVGGIGADSPEKQELDPLLLKASKVVVDIREQAATMGDLHHALRAQIMTLGDVHADLGEVVAGLRPGRTTPDEITVFDSTGTALQDVAVASAVYERAIARGAGRLIDFAR